MAPTGKAALRMSEAFAEHGLRIQATTVHAGLMPNRNGHDGEGWSFRHNRSNPLDCDLLLGDEWSMVETGLQRAVFDAVKPGTRVLLVGDPFQLPPVGHGRPFLDMIEAGIPHGHLTEPHRFAGRIAQVCKAIKDGETWEPSERVDLDAEFPENFRMIERSNPTAQLAMLQHTVEKMRERGFDPFDDVQVLCPVNSNSPISRQKCNETLQRLLNPNAQGIKGTRICIGDKVLCTKNDNRAAVVAPTGEYEDGHEESGDNYVPNGDIGRCVYAEDKYLIVRFGGVDTRIMRKDWANFDLGYALTVHKSQGSQWPVVIPIIDGSGAANQIGSRSLWYTGFSRAKTLCIPIGTRMTLAKHCQRVDIEQRKTFLTERIGSWLTAISS